MDALNMHPEAPLAEVEKHNKVTVEVNTKPVTLKKDRVTGLAIKQAAVEAALGDSKQSEALKAIVRREMFALISRNQAEIYEAVDLQKPGLAPKETHVVGQDELR